MNSVSDKDAAAIVRLFIQKYDQWNREVVKTNIIDPIHENLDRVSNVVTDEDRRRQKIVDDEFDRRIGVLFIGPTRPDSYCGLWTKNGYASDRHGVDGEVIDQVRSLGEDEWVVETTYSYDVADVLFSHQYHYYVVMVGGRLRIAKVMIVDKEEIAGHTVYRDL